MNASSVAVARCVWPQPWPPSCKADLPPHAQQEIFNGPESKSTGVVLRAKPYDREWQDTITVPTTPS